MVNEGTSFKLTWSFFDEDGVAREPDSIRYKISCITNGRVVRDWTSLTPDGESIEIDVSPDDNAILSDKNRTEHRQLQIQTEHGTSNQFVPDPFEWDVRNLA